MIRTVRRTFLAPDHVSPNRVAAGEPAGEGMRHPWSVRDDDGMSTAEYAIGTIAAVAFAGILLKVLSSPAIQTALHDIIAKALQG